MISVSRRSRCIVTQQCTNTLIYLFYNGVSGFSGWCRSKVKELPFACFSCTGAENNICWTNPGAFPPAPRHKSGTVPTFEEGDEGWGAIRGDCGGVGLVVAEDVHVRDVTIWIEHFDGRRTPRGCDNRRQIRGMDGLTTRTRVTRWIRQGIPEEVDAIWTT